MKPDYKPFEEQYSKYESLAATDSENRHLSVPNYLNAVNFRVVIPKLPQFTYFVQSVTIPSLSLNSIDLGFRGFQRTSTPSSLDISDQIILTFGIDEEMQNWQDIYDWMTAITPSTENDGEVRGDPYSQIIVLIYNSQKRLKRKFTYDGCHPVNLSSFDMNVSSTTVEPIVLTTNFAYKKLTITNS